MDLRKLERAATAAPWRYVDYGLIYGPDEDDLISLDLTDADARLIAATRTALPLLLDVVDAARPLQEIAHHEYCTKTYHVTECAAMSAALAALDAGLTE